MLNEEELNKYVAALERTGFFGPDAYYMNHERNAAYAKQARNGGKLDMPVLFLHGDYDYTCETVVSRLAEPNGLHKGLCIGMEDTSPTRVIENYICLTINRCIPATCSLTLYPTSPPPNFTIP